MTKVDLIILCGGLGKRIRSKSKGLPKILINIEKKTPFIMYLLKALKISFFRSIILSIGFRSVKIIEFIKKNKKLNLIYNKEKFLLGTGGGIKDTLKNKKISDPFFVINGDTFFKFNINTLTKKNLDNVVKKSIILLKSNEKEKRYDQFKILKNNKIEMNKKNKNKSLSYINSGLYLFYKKDFRYKKKNFH